MKTMHYILIGGAVAGAVYLGAKLLAPQPVPGSNPLTAIATGLKTLLGTFAGPPKAQTTNGTDSSAGPLGWFGFGDGSGGAATPPGVPLPSTKSGDTVAYYTTGPDGSNDGDAAISDGLGVGKGATRTVMPNDPYTYKQAAIAGQISYSHFTPAPVRAYAG